VLGAGACSWSTDALRSLTAATAAAAADLDCIARCSSRDLAADEPLSAE